MILKRFNQSLELNNQNLNTDQRIIHEVLCFLID